MTLCVEHYWYNPCHDWYNVRSVRVLTFYCVPRCLLCLGQLRVREISVACPPLTLFVVAFIGGRGGGVLVVRVSLDGAAWFASPSSASQVRPIIIIIINAIVLLQ